MEPDFLRQVKADAEELKQAVPRDEQLGLLAQKASKQVDLEKEIEDLELTLKERKAELAKISELEIPELMGTLGVSDFTLKDGYKVKVSAFYAGKITEEKSEQAFDWLEDNGHQGIIKGEFVVMYRRPDKQRIGQFLDLARELGFETKDKLNVHPMTLKAFLKEQIEGGTEDFPRELFGTYTGWKTKISKR